VTRRFFVLLALAGSAVAATPALAATFGAVPATLTVERPRRVTEVELSSLDARRVIFDVSVRRGESGEDVAASSDVVVVPPIFSLAPYGVVVVRIAFRSPPPAGEEHYRVVATEVISPVEQRAGRVPRTVVVPLTRR